MECFRIFLIGVEQTEDNLPLGSLLAMRACCCDLRQLLDSDKQRWHMQGVAAGTPYPWVIARALLLCERALDRNNTRIADEMQSLRYLQMYGAVWGGERDRTLHLQRKHDALCTRKSVLVARGHSLSSE